jgi:geranylgeranyl pyrophosphate synthase
MMDLLKRPFGVDKTVEEARRYAEKALEEARKLPNSEAKIELEMLTRSIFEGVRR